MKKALVFRFFWVVFFLSFSGFLWTSSTLGGSAALADSDTCGAYVAPDVWKEFDCYNLAAIGKTTNDDPFTPSWRLVGGYWQWGRKGPDPSQWYNSNTQHFAQGPTRDSSGLIGISSWDQNGAPNGAWSDSRKTDNDPCPDGYRLPTIAEWQGVVANNTQSIVGRWSRNWDDDIKYSTFLSARFFGNKLMLPAAGLRSERGGVVGYLGEVGFYWSTSYINRGKEAYALSFSSEYAEAGGYRIHDRRRGLSVRCVAE
jgi:uncharacterized protein (TIGR02145 family)